MPAVRRRSEDTASLGHPQTVENLFLPIASLLLLCLNIFFAVFLGYLQSGAAFELLHWAIPKLQQPMVLVLMLAKQQLLKLPSAKRRTREQSDRACSE